MDIKAIGNHLEAVCVGCGEVLLIGSGEAVNYRMGPPMDVGGVELPTPQGLLCAVCSRRENPGSDVSIKFALMACSGCGAPITEEDEVEPDFDEEGNLKSMLCKDCSEPWRTGSCETE